MNSKITRPSRSSYTDCTHSRIKLDATITTPHYYYNSSLSVPLYSPFFPIIQNKLERLSLLYIIRILVAQLKLYGTWHNNMHFVVLLFCVLCLSGSLSFTRTRKHASLGFTHRTIQQHISCKRFQADSVLHIYIQAHV
jgi:hypothetical protein